jgi:hypothetical protein
MSSRRAAKPAAEVVNLVDTSDDDIDAECRQLPLQPIQSQRASQVMPW